MILIKLIRMHKLLKKERTQHGPEANNKFSSQEMRAAIARLNNLFNDLTPVRGNVMGKQKQ